MLKLTYTEHGLYMEQVAAPLEVFVAQRVMLALRAGQPLHVEPGRASFLLAADAPGLTWFERILRQESSASVAVIPVDDEFVEVTVEGSWLAETAAAEEGVFITALTHQTEFLVMKLWETTQVQVSYLV